MTRELRTGWKSSPGQHLKLDWGIRPVSSSPVGIREGSPCAFECGAAHSKRKQWTIHSLMWLLGNFRNEAMVEIIDDPQVELEANLNRESCQLEIAVKLLSKLVYDISIFGNAD